MACSENKGAAQLRSYCVFTYELQRQNVPSDILTLLIQSEKSGKNDELYVLEITLYL